MKYKRILIKLSGQALAGKKDEGFCMETIKDVCTQIKQVSDAGIQVCIVVGAGNIWRGRLSDEMNQVSADNMGMLATVINSIMVEDTLNRLGKHATVMSAVEIHKFSKMYKTSEAIDMMENNEVVIFAAGTGNPFFTTDTAAALRALETQCDIILLAKNIDGVYDSDPNTNKDAKKLKEISFDNIIEQELRVMDLTTSTLCKEGNMPLLVFALNGNNSILRALEGKIQGTIIGEGLETVYY
ncbi:MAG: UMP kinase [Clostridiales bacterium]|nr:UMP kinase [Clostridiales bacterium]